MSEPDNSPTSSSDVSVGGPSDDLDIVEVPSSAASWTLSSAKPGNGIEQLLDRTGDTYWQSDGVQPHLLTISFMMKTKISDLWLQFNYRSDESYTPQQISVRMGSGYHDLQEVQVVDLREPQGWVRVPLAMPPAHRRLVDSDAIRDKSFGGAVEFVRVWCLQVAVICNHQNGRDTHIRQVKLFGPRCERRTQLGSKSPHNDLDITSPEMLSMLVIR